MSTAKIIQFNRPVMQSEENSGIDTGFIKIYRSLQDCSFSDKPEFMSAWLHILMLASYKTRKTMLGGTPVQLESGQFVSGRNALAERVGVSPQTMRTILSFFESEGMISRQSSRQGTIFTVLNYGHFQGEKTQKINQRPPTKINQRSTNDNSNDYIDLSNDNVTRSTNDQPTQSTTTQENNKSISNDIDNIYTSSSEIIQGEAIEAKSPNDYPIEFEWIWQNRPRREGSDPKRKAFQACTARIKQGASWRELAEGMKRYHRYCETKGTLNTEFVKTMAVFFGPDEHFKNEWHVTSNTKTGIAQGKGPNWDDLTWANDLGRF